MILAIATASAEAQAFADLLSGGSLKIYTGTQPATPQDTATGTLLCTVTLGTPAMTVTNNIASISGTPNSTVVADGTSGYGRFLTSGDSPVMDVSVDTSGADVIVNKTSFVTNETLTIQSFSYTRPTS